jgi:hypothetical protein
VEQALLAGVPTYNVLRNPIYARMFRINDEFAASHRHVQSVYHMQVREDDMEAAAFDINLITQHHHAMEFVVGHNSGKPRSIGV